MQVDRARACSGSPGSSSASSVSRWSRVDRRAAGLTRMIDELRAAGPTGAPPTSARAAASPTGWPRRSTTARAAARRCAFGTIHGEDRERLACAACGHIAYVNPRLVVTTLPITDAGESSCSAAASSRASACGRSPAASSRSTRPSTRRPSARPGGDGPARRAGRDRRAVHAARGGRRDHRVRGAHRRRDRGARRRRRPRSRPSPPRPSRGGHRVQDDDVGAARLDRPAPAGPAGPDAGWSNDADSGS